VDVSEILLVSRGTHRHTAHAKSLLSRQASLAGQVRGRAPSVTSRLYGACCSDFSFLSPDSRTIERNLDRPNCSASVIPAAPAQTMHKSHFSSVLVEIDRASFITQINPMRIALFTLPAPDDPNTRRSRLVHRSSTFASAVHFRVKACRMALVRVRPRSPQSKPVLHVS